MQKIKNNETYFPFLAWLKTALFEDSLRAAERMPVLMSYQFHGFDEILRTTPFPVPPQLETVFALLYDADRILSERRHAEAEKARQTRTDVITEATTTTQATFTIITPR